MVIVNINSFNKCIEELNKLFPTFNEKINFIKTCKDDLNFINNKKIILIKSAINF
ncbi:MAG: hypothetical protein K2I36_03050 [Ureaplasma sp.]|nr:hypothetical protein [Ureaplasma sp.]